MRLWKLLREVAWLSVSALVLGVAGVIASLVLPALAVSLGLFAVVLAILSFRE